MSIRSFKTKILIMYIGFMFINSIIPIVSTKGIWRYDKAIHFIEFFILGLLFMNAIIDNKLNFNKLLFGVLILTFIAFIDEGLQYIIDIPGRVPDFYDFVIDIVGEYCGAISFVVLHKMRNING